MSDSGFEELARGALLEVTDPRSVGPLVSEADEGDGVVTLRFESNLSGYLGWKWTVSVAKVGDAAPTVLESELMPGDGALLAPEWVPWSDRLDDYNAARAAAESEVDSADDEELVDDEDFGDDEYDGVDVDAALGDEDDEDDEDDGYEALEDPDDGGEVDEAAGAGDASDVAAVGVDEPQQAEGDAGDAGPDPAGAVGAEEASEAGQQAGERE